MTANTRYALLAGVGILGVGLLAGGAAYITGGAALGAQTEIDELQYVPANARLVAYANVREVMQSSFWSWLREFDPSDEPGLDRPGGESAAGRRWLQEVTGVDLETDIDSLVLGVVPGEVVTDPPSIVGLLAGRFDAPRLEALAREHGGSVEQYAGSMIVTGVPTADENDAADGRLVAMAFVESGVLAMGTDGLVRGAIDQSRGGAGDGFSANTRLTGLVNEVRPGHSVWVVAEFDGLETAELLPEQVRGHIPPLTAMALGGRVTGGVRTTLRVETRDEQAAQDLHQVVQGFVALARIQVNSYPELQPLLESIQLTGEGHGVSLLLDVSPDLLDLVFSAGRSGSP